ncbi:type II toxin-antitoxin system Phd/YefM family antitoxin [Sphingomonas alpina]|uniref:Type II toxin-antitoxin system prevent-host-death family antitoxin n=1 Tax=Sphingomonas alpina TaxID=653931 RepID=A0A7H0LQ31_9SPHN|nr:type II toxin-antitoxin system prevent-host-death family antitoxin [Sphingomonas alpina]QNQ11784.1 type II toxin-antitoxin system prevent-host-death family antitoxin [Sphingomonas alpina]
MTVHATIVGVRELRGKLSDYLRRVAAGENFDIVSRGKKVAELRAPEPDANFRKPGALKGRGWIADDFDTWSPEIEATFDADIFPPDR